MNKITKHKGQTQLTNHLTTHKGNIKDAFRAQAKSSTPGNTVLKVNHISTTNLRSTPPPPPTTLLTLCGEIQKKKNKTAQEETGRKLINLVRKETFACHETNNSISCTKAETHPLTPHSRPIPILGRLQQANMP